MKVVSCVVARTTSTRLPLKVLRSVDSQQRVTLLDTIFSKVQLSNLCSKIYLCTSTDKCDDILEDVAFKNGVSIYRGSAEEVILRLLAVAEKENADYVVRITGDNIFVSGEYLDDQIRLAVDNNLDYCRLAKVPIGATAEVIKVEALKKLYNELDPKVSEYLMLYIFNPQKYRCGVLLSQQDYSGYSITVDTDQDLKNARRVVSILGVEPESLSISNICKLMTREEGLFSKVHSDMLIKLPYDKVITYKDFIEDQNKRISECQVISPITI